MVRLAAIAETSARVALARALDAPDPVRERLVWFWSDHFTTAARSRADAGLPAALVEEAIRPHLAGRFGAMLRAVIRHPAMLRYLDQAESFGPASRVGRRRGRGLNENLARELLELHTIGTGYSQADVRELAELLTGLTVGKQGFRFDPRRAEPGPEEVLGRLYAGEGMAPVEALLADLALRPETARHLARKLAVHFVADEPDPGLVGDLAEVWRATGGDLPAVHAALLAHPAAAEGPARKVRLPFEFVAAALRGLGVTGAEVSALPLRALRRGLVAPLAAMGQPWQRPPGPDGWPEAPEDWITAPRLAARIGWAMAMPARMRRELPDPAAFARATLGARAEAGLLTAVSRAESRAEGLGLVLASPAFNRR
jgi:uncharacterized protein (DUF1800 family)